MKVELSTNRPGAHQIIITFVNDDSDTAYVAKARAFLTAPDGDYLEFDPPAPYLGVTMKRKPYAADELVAIGPGESASATLDVTTLYDVSTGPRASRVRYCASQPLAGTELMSWIESDWIELFLAE